MRAINLLSLTILAGLIAVPAVTFAEISINAETEASMGLESSTTTKDLGVATPADDSTGLESDNSAQIEGNTDTGVESNTDLNTTANFEAYDENSDGAVSKSEFAVKANINAAGSMFNDLDLNRDRRLSQAEFDIYAMSTNNASGGIRASR